MSILNQSRVCGIVIDRVVCALFVALLVAQTVSAQELLTNGGFENGGAGWQTGGDFSIGQLSHPRTGSGYAYLSAPNGTPGDNLYGTLRQTFTVPTNITSASLRFYYSITTTDATAADFLTVWFEGKATQHTFSNLDATSGYDAYEFDLTAYAGQTLTVQFLGTTNSTKPTVFRIDDVSATYTATPMAPSDLRAVGNGSQILMAWTDNAPDETSFEVERTPFGGTFMAWTSLSANITATEDLQPYGTTTCYRVRARNNSGASAYSNTACATSLAPPTLLDPPDGSTTSSTSITLYWQIHAECEPLRAQRGHHVRYTRGRRAGDHADERDAHPAAGHLRMARSCRKQHESRTLRAQ